MRQRNSYSRIVQDPTDWHTLSKGSIIQLFQHCVEKDITSFLINNHGTYNHSLGTAFSESGLSRDEIQFIAAVQDLQEEEEIISRIDKILEFMDTDYLDLLILNSKCSAEVLLSVVQRLRAQGKIVETGVFEDQPGKQSPFLEDFPASARLSAFRFSPGAIKTLTLAKEAPAETTQMLLLESGDWENDHEGLKKIAEKYELRPKELLFAWLLHHKGHFHPVIKGNSESGIDAVVKAFHTQLIDEDFNKLPERL